MGIIPTLFEKSPVAILRKRLEELDHRARRSPPQEDPYYKRIGKYYRKRPGSPNFIGLRVNASTWINSEPYKLLLDYLHDRPTLSKSLQRSGHNCLEQGIGFINAVDCIREMAYDEKPGLRELHKLADMNDVYFYGNWDDAVERLEFYGENTLLTCGCPRLYKTLADRLLREEDVLRENPDIALLYYALMMHDTPERALNKVFVGLKNTRDASRQHVELLFSLRQAVLDGLEYLEENVREFPIYGIPPFDNHQPPFHPDHTPSPRMRSLIQHEIDLIDKDFSTIIEHWRSLRAKVERHLDVLLQLRVLEQQELAVSQSHLATKQQALAIDEARSSRVQSRSVIIFTAITTIFVPLSFFTSYFGMNVTDIVATSHSSGYFWMISIPVTITILVIIFAILRVLRVDQGPEGDEEKGIGRYGWAESGPPWRLRWRHLRSKLKRS
uniref:Uncharacterized protein n=1 Tax=Bionectria ochroleuca TaxID=29856 RepID=A0A0B7KIC1_BIOOC